MLGTRVLDLEGKATSRFIKIDRLLETTVDRILSPSPSPSPSG